MSDFEIQDRLFKGLWIAFVGCLLLVILRGIFA